MDFQLKPVKYSDEDFNKIEEYVEVSGYKNVENYDENHLVSCAKTELKKLNKQIRILHRRGVETPELDDMWKNMTMFLGLKLTDKIISDMARDGEKVNSLNFAISTFREVIYDDLKGLSPKEK